MLVQHRCAIATLILTLVFQATILAASPPTGCMLPPGPPFAFPQILRAYRYDRTGIPRGRFIYHELRFPDGTRARLTISRRPATRGWGIDSWRTSDACPHTALLLAWWATRYLTAPPAPPIWSRPPPLPYLSLLDDARTAPLEPPQSPPCNRPWPMSPAACDAAALIAPPLHAIPPPCLGDIRLLPTAAVDEEWLRLQVEVLHPEVDGRSGRVVVEGSRAPPGRGPWSWAPAHVGGTHACSKDEAPLAWALTQALNGDPTALDIYMAPLDPRLLELIAAQQPVEQPF